MPVDVALLVVTAALAVVALVAALVAVHALRETRRLTRPAAPDVSPEAVEPRTSPARTPVRVEAPTTEDLPGRIVAGRVVVTPTSEQLAAATLGRPSARGVSLARGIVHALRPESRDRIGALVRRSYRDRRRSRLRAGRQAIRTSHPTVTPPSQLWLGEPAPRLETVAVESERGVA